MIALMLGTSEGKNIVSALNEFTDDLLISTATAYGGELLSVYKYRCLNATPLDANELKEMFLQKEVTLLVDASHPYAKEVTNNCRKICSELGIEYLRYERLAVSSKYRDKNKIIFVEDYEEVFQKIKSMDSLNKKDVVILNTTGSRNIKKFMEANILSRVIHRILPSVEVMVECLKLNVKIENIIAIKGPIGLELNKGFIKQYGVKAIILKDSGVQGGTGEKLQAAIEENIYAFIIDRKEESRGKVFNNEKQLIEYIKNKEMN